ncbi:MAG: PD-(D/E)XK nuclease family protein [Oscillospiraceae bacterium]|nr:PD-(D/E)XK nuclease family protein [Oscillospiraceae bacterium]
MLTIIKGRNGSGKTSWCLNRIVERAKQGKESLLIVRENVDYIFEVELVKRLDPSERRYCEVTNMKKLCRDIIRRQGGFARTFLDDPEKIALLRKTVLNCADKLAFYKKRGKDTAFYEMLSQLIEELRNEKAGPEALRKISETCRSDLSKQKFIEIALLLEEYERELEGSYFDGSSEMETAGEMLLSSGMLDGKEVYIDGFFGFNAITRALIIKIASRATNVFVTVECMGTDKDKDGAFAATAKAADRLANSYHEFYGSFPKTVLFPVDDTTKPTGLVNAEHFFGMGEWASDRTDGLHFMKGNNIYDEVEQCADEILRLTREEGVQYRNIVILLRDAAQYQEAILRVFDRYKISYVFDVPETLSYAPCTTFLLAALEMARGIRTDSLLRLLKTGICDIAEEENTILESYVFVHGIEGEDWNKPFTENPEGMGSLTEEMSSLLEETEKVRKKVMGWMEPYLRSAQKAVGADLVKAAYILLESVGGLDKMAEMDQPGRCDAQLSLDMIDRLYLLVGEDRLTRDEVCDLLRIMARSTKALQIPERLDAVVVGETNRPSFQSPENVFVLGMNDGIFPKENFDGVLFTLEERDLLYNNHFYVTGAFEECADMEIYFLYHSCSIATKRLYLSYAEKDHAGNALQLCAEVAAFTERLSLTPISRKPEFGIVNDLTARLRYADALSTGDKYLEEALDKSDLRQICQDFKERIERKPLIIKDKALAKQLAGNEQRISSSKIESFENCRFRFLMRYLLNIQSLHKADISPLEAGNFVHDVMEHMMKELNGDLLSVDESMLILICSRLADSYLDQLIPPESRSRRMQTICNQIKDATCRLAIRLREEQEQSEFRPVDFELSIGKKGDIEGTRYILGDGSSAVVEGKIDRVDLFNSDGVGHVRVVDYKTGEKKFDLSDVWQGLNIQMLLYLFSLKNHGQERYGEELRVAGVLYMPSDPSPQSGEEKASSIYTMKGLLIDDPKVLRAMEANGEGIFIPTKIDKKGQWKKTSLSSLEDFGKLERRIDSLILEMANAIREGNFEAIPARKGTDYDACKVCDYKGVCDHERVTVFRPIKKMSNEEMFGKESV